MGAGTVPTSLSNYSYAPTSELQASYEDIRKFLSLKTTQELLNQVTGENSQSSDNQNNQSFAMSAILSPDGGIFTKDIAKVLQQVNLQPFNDTDGTGDITVYGPGEISYGEGDKKVVYGKDLLKSVGIQTSNFEITGVSGSFASSRLTAENLELKNIIDEIDKKIKKNNSPEEFVRRSRTYDSGTEGTTKIFEDIKKENDELEKQKNSNQGKIDANNIKLSSPPAAQSILSNKINVSPNEASPPDNVHLSLYRHASRYLEPASTASDYCNVFFNAIDSINMSLCVPYFRMNIVDRFAKKKKRYSKLSLAAFLRQTSDSPGDKIFYEAEPFTSNAPSKIESKLKSGKVVGMETFFAPQTLLPDPTELLANPRRLDTSVPLLSLNSFSIGIESVGIALMSKKTADLSITLHDRSRLTDISPLVAVGNFSSLYFEIEWGWIHPHGAASFNNPVARYLNSLRFREVFSPTSYNMTMGEGGAMTISIRLIGGTSLDAVNGSVLNGSFMTRDFTSQLFDRMIKSEIQEESSEEDALKEIRPVRQVLIDASRTGYMNKGEFVDEIWTYAAKNTTSDAERRSLIEKLSDILKSSDFYKNEDVYSVIRNKIPRVSAFAPAYNIFSTLDSRYGSQIDVNDFTSIASYLTLLVGMPLAATGLYSEVQLHTFKFNESAGPMAGKQICDAPIRIQDVFKQPTHEGSLAKNSSISNALTLLSNYLSNPKQPIYGISSMTEYSQIKVDDSIQANNEPASAADDKARNNAEVFKKPENFVTPNIRYILRSVPVKEFKEGASSVADYAISPEKLIAQIIVYDANSSPNFDKIIGAYSYNKLGGEKSEKITPDIAKDVFKRAFPSIVYGATNSVIKGINVSTDINNAISTQNIIDFGKDQFLGRSKSDASTDVGEITLFPGSVTVTMIGLPIIERGQEVYLDLGTGTTLDALYYVTSVKHDLRPGEFTTSLTLTYKGQGSVMSLTTMLEQFNETLKPEQKAPITPVPATSAPTKSSQGSLQAQREYEQAIARLE